MSESIQLKKKTNWGHYRQERSVIVSHLGSNPLAASFLKIYLVTRPEIFTALPFIFKRLYFLPAVCGNGLCINTGKIARLFHVHERGMRGSNTRSCMSRRNQLLSSWSVGHSLKRRLCTWEKLTCNTNYVKVFITPSTRCNWQALKILPNSQT